MSGGAGGDGGDGGGDGGAGGGDGGGEIVIAGYENVSVPEPPEARLNVRLPMPDRVLPFQPSPNESVIVIVQEEPASATNAVGPYGAPPLCVELSEQLIVQATSLCQLPPPTVT